MRVFLSYGYNDRDAWIPALVRPIIEAFGSDVLTGEVAYGGPIPVHVRDQILRSDAMLGFLTRREELGNGRWSTHRWVVEELAVAAAIPIPLIEVRENGIDEQGGIVAHFQRITYDERARDECVSKIAVATATLHLRSRLKMQLLPEDFVSAVRSSLSRPGSRCTYTYLDGATQSQPIETRVFPVKGGLFCYVPNVPQNALVQIRFEAAGRSWVSDYESPDALNVNLHPEI